MIKTLTLTDVGPARALSFEFSPRLNVLTGDNGLGKTFVLDVLWWVLTTTWAGEKAFPFRPLPKDGPSTSRSASGPRTHSKSGSAGGPRARSTSVSGSGLDDADPGIQAVLTKREGEPQEEIEVVTRGAWKWASQEWVRMPWQQSRQSPGSLVYPEQHDEAEFRPQSLVIYARIDGSYAVFDAHYVPGGMASYADAAIVLSPSELWGGKEVADPEVEGGKRTVIGGLIADWVSWQQRKHSPEFDALRKVLHALWPPDDRLAVDLEPTRVHLRDRRDIPVIGTPYGIVPVTLASAAMKRALSLAYLLVWAWAEHEKAAKVSNTTPTRDVVLLIDEPELHQHPAWQRMFLPAILTAVGRVAPNAAVQVFTATHSPLVLASLETLWVEELDDLFVLARDGSVVRANEQVFAREGDVTNWLASSVFGGVSGRSKESELAIKAAQHFMAERLQEAEAELQCLYALMDSEPRAPEPDDLRTWGSIDLVGTTKLVQEVHKTQSLVERVHDALKQTLPGHDRFWVHWSLVYPLYQKTMEG